MGTEPGSVTWETSVFPAKEFCDMLGIPKGHKFVAVLVDPISNTVTVYSRPVEESN